jgi:hypothetical protein
MVTRGLSGVDVDSWTQDRMKSGHRREEAIDRLRRGHWSEALCLDVQAQMAEYPVVSGDEHVAVSGLEDSCSVECGELRRDH